MGMALLAAGAASACEMRMRWSEDPPYSFMREDGRIGGIDIEIAELALRRLGCRLLPAPLHLTSEPSHQIISRRSVAASFVARYYEVLITLRKDGSLKAILARHGV